MWPSFGPAPPPSNRFCERSNEDDMTTLNLRHRNPPFVVTHARATGFLLLLPVPLVLLGSLASKLVEPGSPATTADQILASEMQFRLGVISTLLLFVADALLLVLVFYRLLKPVNPDLAVLMVVLNALGVSIAMLNELLLLAVPTVLRAASPGAADQAQLLLDVHQSGALIAGFFWGLWLVPYAVLVFRSGFLPRFFAALLMIECLGFLIPSIGGLLWPDRADDLAVLSGVTSWVELFLPLWLIIRGISAQRWREHTPALA